ncbi:hypothetical protein [Radiobacillus deserti]|nr:hypothetical protein [Radiobacillus deserti]
MSEQEILKQILSDLREQTESSMINNTKEFIEQFIHHKNEYEQWE